MTQEVVLVLMSVSMVLPVMIALLYLVFTGRLNSTEEARSMPMLDHEDDVWQHEKPHDPRSSREKAR